MIGVRSFAVRPRYQASATATLVQENLEVGAAAKGPEPFCRTAASVLYVSQPSSKRKHVPGNARTEGNSTRPLCPERFGSQRFQSDRLARVSRAISGRRPAVSLGNLRAGSGGQRTCDRRKCRDRSHHGQCTRIFSFQCCILRHSPGEFVGRYSKMHLVPFGEYVPFKDLFFFAQNLLHEAGTFDAGATRTLFSVNGHRYGTFICYESIFGDEIRQFVRNGADVLINISNDGWYGDTSAPWQHLNHGQDAGDRESSLDSPRDKYWSHRRYRPGGSYRRSSTPACPYQHSSWFRL